MYDTIQGTLHLFSYQSPQQSMNWFHCDSHFTDEKTEALSPLVMFAPTDPLVRPLPCCRPGARYTTLTGFCVLWLWVDLDQRAALSGEWKEGEFPCSLPARWLWLSGSPKRRTLLLSGLRHPLSALCPSGLGVGSTPTLLAPAST